MEKSAEQLHVIEETEQYIQCKQDAVTWLAEVLEGSMRSDIVMHFDGKELWSNDGRAMGEVCHTAIQDAETMYEISPQSGFELRRRILEYDEYQEMLAMARDELPNTMIVVSDFPAELLDAKEDVGGYNVHRRQTMLRVIWLDEEQSLHVVSQSLDSSNRRALEAIYEYFGREPLSGELLGQRIHEQMSPERQSYLADELMGVYDRTLTSQYGGKWRAGRRDEGVIDTYSFVNSQNDLIDGFARQQQSSSNVDARALYNLAAQMEERFNTTYGLSPVVSKSYSGCGITVTADAIEYTNSLEDAGYGNKTSPEDYKFDKYMHCVVCQSPPKKGESKRMCGPCGICKRCDTDFKSKAKAA